MRRTAFGLMMTLMLMSLSFGIAVAQETSITGITVLANRDNVNIRLVPAIGAEVIGFVDAGWTAPATGRSPDDQWVRVDFNGEEGWIGFPVITLFGDLNALPVRDPRTIPFGGFETPRAGLTSVTSATVGRLADSGVRVRAGPGRSYPILANAPRFTAMSLLGRTINNAWLQVNFESTLGWVKTELVEIQGGASLLDLPVNGIIADSLPLSQPTEDEFINTLRLMLSRVDLAQPSLDEIRAVWTEAALGGRPFCGGFPARPNDFNIAQPIHAAFFPIIDPVLILFNDGMANVRLAIELFLEACNTPGQGFVSQATVSGALDAVNLADGQFAEVRRRLNELLPPIREVGPNECLFTFQGESDILPVLGQGELTFANLNPRQRAVGFCFDAAEGDVLQFETLHLNESLRTQISVSPFDNPTNFIAVGRASTSQFGVTVSGVQIDLSARYLLIISQTGDDVPDGDAAVIISNITGVSFVGPILAFDPVTGDVIVNPVEPAFTTFATPTPLPQDAVGACPSLSFTCEQLLSCSEAFACLAAGNTALDPDRNGVPCELNLCTP